MEKDTANHVSPTTQSRPGDLAVSPPPAYPYGSSTTMVTVQQPVVGVAVQQPRAPDDYMGLAIFTTLCCFWPVGIFAILKARDVHKRTWQGDTAGAMDASRSARRLSFIALAIGILGIIISIVFMVVSLVIEHRIINTAISFVVTEQPSVTYSVYGMH
ncbi:proline-rich transmembrane protein 1-like isoform X2 [Ptychodera flava]|uniref:proline-rich transmembrane protein 1-like isoform X2 n=1 Tax=Ptychodera flava TaxID=63121 RepID=UPI00396A9E0C